MIPETIVVYKDFLHFRKASLLSNPTHPAVEENASMKTSKDSPLLAPIKRHKLNQIVNIFQCPSSKGRVKVYSM